MFFLIKLLISIANYLTEVMNRLTFQKKNTLYKDKMEKKSEY